MVNVRLTKLEQTNDDVVIIASISLSLLVVKLKCEIYLHHWGIV